METFKSCCWRARQTEIKKNNSQKKKYSKATYEIIRLVLDIFLYFVGFFFCLFSLAALANSCSVCLYVCKYVCVSMCVLLLFVIIRFPILSWASTNFRRGMFVLVESTCSGHGRKNLGRGRRGDGESSRQSEGKKHYSRGFIYFRGARERSWFTSLVNPPSPPPLPACAPSPFQTLLGCIPTPSLENVRRQREMVPYLVLP